MNKKLFNKILAILTSILLLVGLVPSTTVAVMAATVDNITYLDENGTKQTAASATQVTNSDTQWTDGWYVAQSNITIDGTVTISGNVHLILEDGCNLTVNGGILLQSDGNMYIYAQSTEKERMGSLTATGTDAGFKEAGYDGTQTLTIAGGKISASGSDVGISAVNLTITDGYVSALGTDLYGDSIAVYNATISGGFVDLYGDFTGTLSTGIDGHAVISSTGEIKNIAADCKGFFLIQKTGKIYGDTFTLTQDLNIANSNIVVTVEEGQTLTLDDGVTLTIPVIATLTNNGIVNNNGTIINTGTLNNSGTLNNNGNLNNTSVLNNAGSIINNGTLTGEVNGSGTVTPKITTDSPLPEGTVDKSYTTTLQGTGNNITWSSDDLPIWLTLDSSTGVISGTPTMADTYTFTVTATNTSGIASKEYMLNIKAVSVTSLKLNKDNLTLQEKSSDTLTATVEPANATNQDVTWKSSDTNIATVNAEGTVTAISAGTATITATAQDGSEVSDSCSVTVTHGNMVHTSKKQTTCTENGNTEYWTCSTCGKYFSDAHGNTEVVKDSWILPATGHKYGEPTWEWANDNTAKAIFKCEKGDDTQNLSGIMSSKITKDATCNAKGIRTYTAKVTFGGKEYTATKDIEIPALSCNTSQGNDQPYDDGGPFTRNECGDVFDRWGNLIYDAPDCVVKQKPTTSPQTTLKPENTTETTLDPVETEEPEQSPEPEKTTTPKPTIQASSTPDSDVKIEKENSFGFIWWILGGIGVVIVGIVAYLVIKNNTEDDE